MLGELKASVIEARSFDFCEIGWQLGKFDGYERYIIILGRPASDIIGNKT
jgi:hypothetical protein